VLDIFKSATLKLTGWYLAILMTISLIFSVAIYQLNYQEVNLRLENFQKSLSTLDFLIGRALSTEELKQIQSREASRQMIVTLLNVNLFILVSGGAGSYFLARRTLRPLEKAHDAQRRFTSDASHELRTPLAAMKTELEVALRDTSLTARNSREILESNLEEVNKLIALSEMLLKLAKLDYDTLEFTRVDMQSLLTQTLKRFPDAKGRISVTTKRRRFAAGNEAALQEVMTVLIDNALKYSPSKSTVSVAFFERRLMAGFSISNEGPAIPGKMQEKIFERFYRSDESRTDSGKNGYGLGLAIAKKIVTIHHGELTVVSNKNLTTFTCLLPSRRAQ
jgi:signal transduction histidine kinase